MEETDVKKYYDLVVSVLDEYGNRVDSYPITGSGKKSEILAAKDDLKEEIANGKYDTYKMKNCTLSADIEVHDDYSYELLWIE